MIVKERPGGYAVVLIATGYDETAAVAILAGLRRAGAHAKSLGLISGLIGGLHGVWVMPDITLADLSDACSASSVDLVVLQGGEAYLTALRSDPRVRELLQRVLGHGGWIATNTRALKTVRDFLWQSTEAERGQILLHFPEQPIEAFVEELVLHYLRQRPAGAYERRSLCCP
jgi:hypothetical protein